MIEGNLERILELRFVLAFKALVDISAEEMQSVEGLQRQTSANQFLGSAIALIHAANEAGMTSIDLNTLDQQLKRLQLEGMLGQIQKNEV